MRPPHLHGVCGARLPPPARSPGRCSDALHPVHRRAEARRTLPAEGAAAAAAAPPGAEAREAVPAIDCGHGRKIPCLKLIKAGK